MLLSQPRSQSSSAISDVTSPVKLVGKARAIALGSKPPLINPGPSCNPSMGKAGNQASATWLLGNTLLHPAVRVIKLSWTQTVSFKGLYFSDMKLRERSEWKWHKRNFQERLLESKLWGKHRALSDRHHGLGRVVCRGKLRKVPVCLLIFAVLGAYS